MPSELLQNALGDLVSPFGGLVGIGGGAQRDGFIDAVDASLVKSKSGTALP